MAIDEGTRARTIEDFGNQWKIHGDLSADFWTSTALLEDYLCKLVDPSGLKGKKVAEVGSGSGRIIGMLSRFQPAELHAVEPSAGVAVLRANTRDLPNVIVHHERGEAFRIGGLDFVFSLGVIHHIKDPADVLRNIRENLKPGGKLVVWVYGKENNGAYLFFYHLLCRLTQKMSDRSLERLSQLLNLLLVPYIWLCRFFPLPLRAYLLRVLAPCSMEKRKFVIFDQLNPAYAKYYTGAELEAELAAAGFRRIRLAHRHGYSWTAVCER